MNDLAAGCAGAVVGCIGGAIAGIVIGEQFVRPGIDGLPSKLAIIAVSEFALAGLAFIAARRAARRGADE